MLLRVVTLLVVLSCSGCMSTAVCDITDRAAILKLDLETFDQAPGQGWRRISAAGCFAEAAQLIDQYEAKHGPVYHLSFHAAQLLLMAGDYAAARTRLRRSYRDDMPADSRLKWNEYVDAYLAFVDNDAEGLKQARAEISSGADYRGNQANLRVVDDMLANLDKPYREIVGNRE